MKIPKCKFPDKVNVCMGTEMIECKECGWMFPEDEDHCKTYPLCPECQEVEEMLNPGLIVTEVVELTAEEFEEYKRYCENNPTASYDDLTLEDLQD